MQVLSKGVRTYFGSPRLNDFYGADDQFGLWSLDEFNEAETQEDGAYKRHPAPRKKPPLTYCLSYSTDINADSTPSIKGSS